MRARSHGPVDAGAPPDGGAEALWVGEAGPPLRVARATRPARAWVSRLAWAVLVAGPAAVFFIATRLTPDPSGLGTHTQLGLAPCGFYAVTGLPCPGCGLTTCFAHMVRGELAAAASANPFGVGLFVVAALMIPVGLVGLARGLPVLETLDRLRLGPVLIALSVFALLSWGVRLALL
ncbi:MAG: DUF2752 domain-containing protein [Myxococcales bacterium]|nr:DUF2752 domain-containing protein [Myxococcales bacterium]